jgi:hypothetical protein
MAHDGFPVGREEREMDGRFMPSSPRTTLFAQVGLSRYASFDATSCRVI